MSTWQYIDYAYPVSYNFEKFLVWISQDVKCYFALKEKFSDSFTYFAGDVSNDLLTGMVLTQYAVENSARTHYLQTTRNSSGKVIAILPKLVTAKFVRIYILDENPVSVYEFRPSTQMLADEIVAGVLEITDKFASPPLIRVSKSDTDRILIGNIYDDRFGLVGYDAISDRLFEFSDFENFIAGWNIEKDRLYTNEIEISSVNGSIKTTDFADGPLGTGWKIDKTEAVFQNISARGKISCSVFEKDTVSAINGSLFIGKADVLDANMTSSEGSVLKIKGATSFLVGEILLLRDATNTEYLQVMNIASAPTYTVTRDLQNLYTINANPAWTAGTAVVSLGKSGNGFIILDSSSTVSPTIQICKRTSNVWSGYSQLITLGNLKNLLDYISDEYGIFIGDANKYLSYDPTNGLRLKGTLKVDASSGTLSTAPNCINIDANGIKGYNRSSQIMFAINLDGSGQLGKGTNKITWDINGDVSIPGELVVGQIDAGYIKVGTITADKANIEDLSALSSNIGNIDRGFIYGAEVEVIGNFFAPGRRIWIHENVAPLGWEIDTDCADQLLAVKGGVGAYNVDGGSINKGVWEYISVAGHILTTDEIPAHTHVAPIAGGYEWGQGDWVYSGGGTTVSVTGSTGGGGSHSHTTTVTRPLANVGIIIERVPTLLG
jgi:hypothetical protein